MLPEFEEALQLPFFQRLAAPGQLSSCEVERGRVPGFTLALMSSKADETVIKTDETVMKGWSMKSMKTLSASVLCAAFTLGAAVAAAPKPSPHPVDLGSAAKFAVLAGQTVTNTGLTIINGDLGVWPGSAVTGFGPGEVNGTIHAGDVPAQHAQASLTIAYDDAAARTTGVVGVAGDLGGQTLGPGLYKSTSTLAITGDLTLDAEGNKNAVFIFQIASGLTVGSTSGVVLSGGAQAANVFWQVGSSATLGTGSYLKGTILALTSISLATGATLDGRALARNGEVTLQANVITVPRVKGKKS